MEKKKTPYISLIITLIISVTIVGIGVGASSLPQIHVNPPTYTATTLDPFTIDINIANVSNLQVVEFKLGYNTTILDATNVTQGPFMKIGSNIMSYEINDSLGYVEVAIGIMTGGPAQGNGTLATITFNPTYYGSASCTLDLYGTKLFDPEGLPIDHDIADGYYEFIILYLTVATGKLIYIRNETVSINGTLSLDGSLVEGLVALEAKDPSDKTFILRTLKTGTNPQVGDINIIDLYPSDPLGDPQNNFTKGSLAYFNVTVYNNGTVSKTVALNVNIYDADQAPRGVAINRFSVSPGSYSWSIFGVPIPTSASSGNASVYASAFTGSPSVGGVAYCPERSATFKIIGSGGGGSGATTESTLGSYNLTFKLPAEAPSGAYRVYVSSGYQGLSATKWTLFGVEAIFVPLLYPTIQEAVDAATPEYNTIIVESGTYYEHVTINKSLILIGQDPSNTIIDGNGTGTVLNITANNVEITRFTIRNSGSSYAGGIILYSSSGITISENTISNNHYGIHLNRSTSITLRSNIMTSNTYNFGVEGNSPSHFIHDIDTSNRVDGKIIYYWVNQQNKEIPSDAGYVAIVNSKNIIVKALTLTKNGQGVLFANANNSLIERVNTQNNKYGIYLYRSYNNIIIGSTVSNNAIGIHLNYSNENIICHQNFINNTSQIELQGSSNTWEDGAGKGNYWSGYMGQDLNGDGVGDTLLPHLGVDYYPLMNPRTLVHDIAVTNVILIPYRYIPTYNLKRIYSGWVINVNATIKNEGDFTETFYVYAYFYNETYSSSGLTVASLAPLEKKNVTVACTTTGSTPLLNYTIKSTAVAVPGETDTADNTKVDGTVKVGWPGDTNDDRKVGLPDLMTVAMSYRKDLWNPDYSPQADFNGDGKVELPDLMVLAMNYRKGPAD